MADKELTANLNLELVDIGESIDAFVDAYNASMGALDALPLPSQTGSNSQMDYVKFTNGLVIMYGRLDLGTDYPCTRAAEDETYYTSSDLTITYPATLVDAAPVVLAHVAADPWSDVWWLTREASTTSMRGCFYCRGNDSEASNKKSLNILVIGRWK